MEEFDILDFLKYVVSKLYILISIIIIVLVVGNIYSRLIKKPLYKSYTTLVLVSDTNEKYTQSDSALNKNLVKTYSNIIKSKTILNKIIDNLSLKYSYTEISNMINVTSVKDTEIIKISVSSRDAKESAAIANAIVPVFKTEVERIYGIENLGIIDVAEVSKSPYNINPLKENVLYFLIGFLLGSIIVLCAYFLDSSIKSVEMIEDKLGLTVLGTIPKIEGRD